MAAAEAKVCAESEGPWAHEIGLEWGPDFLSEFVSRCFDRLLLAGMMSPLLQFVSRFPDVPFGTMCSGTDCPAMAFQAIISALRELSHEFRCPHVFSAEKRADKRSFIASMFKDVGAIFKDMIELAEGTAHQCWLRKAEVPLRRVLILVAGFPCTTVSRLNPKAATLENQATIRTGEGATGSCFAAIIRFAKLWAVPVLILENVLGLKRLLNEVLDKLGAAGYAVFCDVFDSRDFCLPQARQRYWFVAMKMELFPGMSCQQIVALVQHLVQTMKRGHRCMPLSSFLLPDTEPLIHDFVHGPGVGSESKSSEGEDRAADQRRQLMLQRASGAAPDEPSSKHRKTGKRWVAAHADVWPSGIRTLADGQVYTGSPESFVKFPYLKRLCLRKLDILMTLAPALPESPPRLLDTSQSIGRKRLGAPTGSKAETQIATLTPSGAWFHTGLGRDLHGVEALALQGIYISTDIAAKFSSSLLQNLAGNAFSSTCCVVAIIAALTALGQSTLSLATYHEGPSQGQTPSQQEASEQTPEQR
jgi:site-specific DNA-cytosine methylase